MIVDMCGQNRQFDNRIFRPNQQKYVFDTLLECLKHIICFSNVAQCIKQFTDITDVLNAVLTSLLIQNFDISTLHLHHSSVGCTTSRLPLFSNNFTSFMVSVSEW
jgi:hypothetical protein